jgi:class 3 adenylate cyclase
MVYNSASAAFMDKDKLQDVLESKAPLESNIENVRTPVTILFSDIKGFTAYFEKYGDVLGMAMLERHNNLLFPHIQGNGGRIIKTIGDSIMASFEDPSKAVRAAAEMQRALAGDRDGRPDEEHIHVRVGLHTGLGVLKDNDIFGDVVNAAARVQKQAQPNQILITDVLLDSAKNAGFQCAAFGKAEMKGKDEPIDLFAVAWSQQATDQLIDEVQARFEAKLKEAKQQYEDLEAEFENSRDQWRAERRKMSVQIEQIEDAADQVREKARAQVTSDLHSEVQFQLQEAMRVKEDLQRQFEAAEARWNTERDNLKAQIAAMQASVIEAMEKSNNPARMGTMVREQVDARLAGAKQEWELGWQTERRQLTSELERLKKTSGASDERKEAARLALLQKLGKLPPGSAIKSPEQLRQELERAKRQWETERDELLLKIKRLENEATRSKESIRAEIYQELHSLFEPKLVEAHHERQLLKIEVQKITAELDDERSRLNARIAELQQSVKEAEAAARSQAAAEIHDQLDVKINEATRARSRAERKLQDISEELESERRRAKRQIAQLEEQLREAKEVAFKATRQFRN